MNKKILIRSIIATSILIGVSFTSVVGYRSIESDVKASPLFNIRSSRAIDEENGDFSCEYVGKDIGVLNFPSKLDSNVIKLQEVINLLNNMSNEAFDRFILLVINHLQNENNFKNINSQEIILAFNKLRDTHEIEKDYNIIEADDTPLFPTGEVYLYTADGVWAPGCLIWEILDIILTILLSLEVIYHKFPTGDVFLCTSGGIWAPGCLIWQTLDIIITILLLLPVYFYTCGPCGPHPLQIN